MRIMILEIHNWRSIKNVTMEFMDIMIFIGQNNHGKSNILSAILFFLGQLRHDDLDFNVGSNELYVEITFDKLDLFDRNQFQKYVASDGTLKVRKIAFVDGNFEYHGYLEIPAIDWLKEENIGDYSKREEAEKLPLVNYLPDSGRITKEVFRKAQEDYIKANMTILSFNYELEKSNFLGAKNVAKGIWGEVYHVPSVRNASDELSVKGGSVFSQLYSHVINKMSDSNPQYIEAKKTIIALMKILNKKTDDGDDNTKRPVELTTLEKNLEYELSNWNTQIDIEITPPNIEDIFRVGATVWVNDGIKTDINRKGHGLQRALIFALIKSWAKLLKKEREKEENSENEDYEKQNSSILSTRQSSNSRYFIFEEPELYLHPQAQRELYSSLVDLSESQNQVMLCTHSSFFIDLERYKSICIIRKNNLSEGTKTLQCTDDLFDEGEEKKKFDILYWINPDRGEMFFAKKVILVEGATEKAVIPYLAKTIGKFRFDYTLIDCASKYAMPTYITLLNKFSIPYVVVFDKDHQADKKQDAINSTNKINNKIETLIDRSIGASEVFENDFEEELGIAKGKKKNPYFALQNVESSTFRLSNQLQAKVERMFS